MRDTIDEDFDILRSYFLDQQAAEPGVREAIQGQPDTGE